MISSKLILSSGESFSGLSPEWQQGDFFGEVVFTTGMTGYVESLTDPSYAGQILVFTYPLIGNYGVPDKSFWESGKIQASGVVIGTADASSDHWNAKKNLFEWLESEKIPLIANVDTRALTKVLRKNGVALGAIATGKAPISFSDPNRTDLIAKVSCKESVRIREGTKRIIAVDCGMKENIVRSLSKYPIELVRVPYDTDYSKEAFDGLFISNGPGDPAKAKTTIAILQKALSRKKPTFGICLGAQTHGPCDRRENLQIEIWPSRPKSSLPGYQSESGDPHIAKSRLRDRWEKLAERLGSDFY